MQTTFLKTTLYLSSNPDKDESNPELMQVKSALTLRDSNPSGVYAESFHADLYLCDRVNELVSRNKKFYRHDPDSGVLLFDAPVFVRDAPYKTHQVIVSAYWEADDALTVAEQRSAMMAVITNAGMMAQAELSEFFRVIPYVQQFVENRVFLFNEMSDLPGDAVLGDVYDKGGDFALAINKVVTPWELEEYRSLSIESAMEAIKVPDICSEEGYGQMMELAMTYAAPMSRDPLRSAIEEPDGDFKALANHFEEALFRIIDSMQPDAAPLFPIVAYDEIEHQQPSNAPRFF